MIVKPVRLSTLANIWHVKGSLRRLEIGVRAKKSWVKVGSLPVAILRRKDGVWLRKGDFPDMWTWGWLANLNPAQLVRMGWYLVTDAANDWDKVESPDTTEIPSVLVAGVFRRHPPSS